MDGELILERGGHSSLHGSRKEINNFSSQLYGIDWDAYFPALIPGTEYIVRKSNFEECTAFTQRHYQDAFLSQENSSGFLWNDSSERRKEFYRQCGDFFLFEYKGETVGVYCSNPIDWSSYYLRHTLILKEHQGSGLYQEFFAYLMSILKAAGVERVEADMSPANTKHLAIMLKQGFQTQGLYLSDRWGALIKMVHFFEPKNKDVFYRQFCHGVRTEVGLPEAKMKKLSI